MKALPKAKGLPAQRPGKADRQDREADDREADEQVAAEHPGPRPRPDQLDFA